MVSYRLEEGSALSLLNSSRFSDVVQVRKDVWKESVRPFVRYRGLKATSLRGMATYVRLALA
jgi:hypothetical protein